VICNAKGGKSYHIVDPTEEAPTIVPLTRDHRIVLRLVACAILLAGEAALSRLRTTFLATEKRFRVSFVMLAQITSASEARSRCAAWPCARPATVRVLVAVVCDRTGVGRHASGNLRDAMVEGCMCVGVCRIVTRECWQ
jgi:hypothetical protein